MLQSRHKQLGVSVGVLLLFSMVQGCTLPASDEGVTSQRAQISTQRSRQSVARAQVSPRQQQSRGEAITVSRSGGDASGGSGSAGSGGASGGGASGGASGGGASGGGASGGGASGGGASGGGASGGGASGGGASGDSGGWSDRRLKTDIVRLGTSPSGLGIYAFNYVWGGQTVVGAMADEVASVAPEAVIARENGYLWVNYARIDVRMMPYTEWLARHER